MAIPLIEVRAPYSPLEPRSACFIMCRHGCRVPFLCSQHALLSSPLPSLVLPPSHPPSALPLSSPHFRPTTPLLSCCLPPPNHKPQLAAVELSLASHYAFNQASNAALVVPFGTSASSLLATACGASAPSLLAVSLGASAPSLLSVSLGASERSSLVPGFPSRSPPAQARDQR